MATESRPFAEIDGITVYFETINRVINYRYVGGEVLTVDRDGAAAFLGANGFDLVDAQPRPAADGRHRVLLLDDTGVPDAVDALSKNGFVSSPHRVYTFGNHTQFGPADAPRPVNPPGWAVDVLDELAGPLGRGRIVAIIDSGILKDQSPFPVDALAPLSDVDPGPPPGNPNDPLSPFIGHGTFVAGRVLRHAPTAKIIMVRPTLAMTINGASLSVSDGELALKLGRALAVARGDDVHEGNLDNAVTFASGQAEALEPEQVPHVLNLSLSGPVHNPAGTDILSWTRGVLDVWVGLGTHIVAAAGNDHVTAEHYPGAWRDVICVGACDGFGRVAEFSNSGDWVDVYAPGVDVDSWYLEDGRAWTVTVPGRSRRKKSTGPFGGYAEWSGTSFAAPTVAGLIAR